MNILICAAHTDDETIGAGGSIARWVEEGNQVHVLCFSTCYESLPRNYQGLPGPYITETELGDACEILGCTFSIHETPVRHFPEHRQSILETLTYYKRNYNPNLVVGPSINDIHQDHKTVAEEMRRCFWRYCNIISYELPWNSARFNPTLFVGLSWDQEEKRDLAIEQYRSQIEKDSGDVMRIASDHSNCRAIHHAVDGDTYAEAFEVIRWIL